MVVKENDSRINKIKNEIAPLILIDVLVKCLFSQIMSVGSQAVFIEILFPNKSDKCSYSSNLQTSLKFSALYLPSSVSIVKNNETGLYILSR